MSSHVDHEVQYDGKTLGVTVSFVISALDGKPVLYIDTDFEPTGVELRVRLNDALATEWDGYR